MDWTKPVDIAFTRTLPKIEVHAHLSGSISRNCLREIWQRKKAADPAFDVMHPDEVMPPGKVDFNVNIFFRVFPALIYQLCTDLASLRYATRHVLSSFAADGVRYLELRTTPRASPAHDIDKQTYVQTILDVIQEFEEEQKREEKDDSRRMATYLLLSIDRAAPVADAEDTLAVAVALRDHRLLGLDLCGNPNAGTAAAFVSLLTRARADHGLRLTVHFGETATAGTDAELEALLACGPSRLGHVIYVGDRVAAEVARRRLGLELCLSCNVHAGMVEGGFEKHHFGTWWLQGAEVRCPILLSTDDVGFFESPLSNEYLLAARHFGMDRRAAVELARGAIPAIFGPEHEKARLERLLAEFEQKGE